MIKKTITLVVLTGFFSNIDASAPASIPANVGRIPTYKAIIEAKLTDFPPVKIDASSVKIEVELFDAHTILSTVGGAGCVAGFLLLKKGRELSAFR